MTENAFYIKNKNKPFRAGSTNAGEGDNRRKKTMVFFPLKLTDQNRPIILFNHGFLKKQCWWDLPLKKSVS